MLKYRKIMANGLWRGPWHSAPCATVDELAAWLRKNG